MLSYRLAFLLGFLTAGCAASQSTPVEPWRVSVTSSGGFAGHGMGSYAIGSDGVVSVTTMAEKTCTFTATPEELARFRTLLGAAKAEQWRESYVPKDTCCDRIEWTLTVQEGERTVTTKWLDQPEPRPPDLAALADAMAGGPQSLRVVYEPRCREGR